MTVHTTEQGFKLGKLEARPPLRAADKTFGSVVKASAPEPPEQAHYGARVTAPWQMWANGPDPTVTLPGVPPNWGGCGDCTIAMVANWIFMSNYDEYGHTVPVPTANDVVTTYCSLAGCTPEQLFEDPNTYDTGLDMANVFEAWYGQGLFGTRIAAYYKVDYTNILESNQAMAFGGGLGWGWQLPASAEQEFPGEWTYVPGSQVVGGHATLGTGYHGKQKYSATWAALIKGGITPAFVSNYADELWTVVTPQAIAAAKGPNPGYGAAALDVEQIEADFPALDG